MKCDFCYDLAKVRISYQVGTSYIFCNKCENKWPNFIMAKITLDEYQGEAKQ